MKNRKRILALLLAGFVSVSTAFSANTSVAFAAEATETSETMELTSESTDAASEAETSDSASEEGSSAETVTEEAEETAKETVDETVADAAEESTSDAAAETPSEEAGEAPAEAAEEEAVVTITSIAEAVAGAANTEFTVKGVINYISGANVYVEDETGAICLYLKKADSTLKVGNLVTATGSRKDYKGLAELASATIVEVDADNTVDYGFNVIKPAQFKNFVTNYNDYECKKVVVKGVKITELNLTAGKATVGIDSTTALVYDKNIANYFTEDYKVGDTVNLTAVVCDYNGIELIPITDDQHPYVELVDPEQEEEDDGTVTVDESITAEFVSFAGTNLTGHAGDMVVYADLETANDCKDTANELTAVIDGKAATPVYTYKNNGTEVSISGSVGMKTGGYYQLALAGKGYGLYTLSFTMRGSKTGAKDWQASYSVDGENFTDFGDKIVISDKNAEYKVALPKDVMHVEKLYIRMSPTSDTSINGKTVAGTGVNRFQNIKVSGSPVIAGDTVGYVKVSPEAGEVRMGTALTMESATKNATIYFTVNGGEEQTYDPENKPTLEDADFVTASELDAVRKAIVVAYAKAEGRADSVKTTYIYNVAQVGTVKASPNGGAVRLGTNVALRCQTEGAKIFYSTDKGENWTEYAEQIKVTELPLQIMAKATCEGMLESNVATFDFTERLNEEYNIYFGQIHSHTSYSDGAGTADEAFNHAANEVDNLDFLAVTDHSNSYDNDTKVTITDGSASAEWTEGHELAKKYTSDSFVGLFGYEMTWSGGAPGHINTFNTAGFMSRNMTGYESQSRVALQNYYAQIVSVPESISMFNHPGTTFGDFYDFAYYSKANDQQISLIEVGNGEGAIGSAGYFPSYEYYTRALDKGWHVAPANNQDNHKGRWGDANTGRTVVLADSLTEENIYDALRNMRVYATEDNDLHIYYTLNGLDMGSVCDEVPSEVNIKVKTSDVTDSGMMTLEVISNNGLSVASKQVEESSAVTEFTLTPDKSYYYIKITQADGDIAVTAPIWIADVEAIGVGSLSVGSSLAVAGEALDISANFYNNENSDFEVSSIVYTVAGEVVHTTDLTQGYDKIPSRGEISETFSYTCNEVGKKPIEVTLLGYLNGVAKKYTAQIDVTYISPEMVTHVVVDGSHHNDYVSGYYGGNVGNFADIAAYEYVKVDVVTEEITADTLKDAKVFVVSAPAKKKGNYNGTAYDPTHFEDSFIEVVKEYVANGGNLIVCGIADYSDTKDGQSSTEINKLLEAIGATTKLNSDELMDDEKNGGQNYRLYFTEFNRDSYLVKGVTDTQTYSAYSGCSVLVDADAMAQGKAEPVVYGHASTYGSDTKQFDSNFVDCGKGNIVALAREDLVGGGELLVAGTVFLSDFEVKTDLDYGGQEFYANRNILLNYLAKNQKQVPVSTIAQMRQGNPGDIFTVEGYVTAGTAVEGNKFFDTIYIQDDTAGTTVFPIADLGIELGTKIRLTGYVDGYQGDLEIQIYSYKILDEEKKVYDPKKVTTKEATDYAAVGGSLLQVEGKVTRVVTNTSGVDYFFVEDESGVEARVFIDGYILASDGNDTVAEDVKVGNTVSAVGLCYCNPDGVCLRVRDRAEIVLTAEASEEPEQPEVKNAKLVTKWGSTYYVTEDGEKLTGRQVIEGETFFFNLKTGSMVKSSFVEIDGQKYYFGSDGKMVTGFMTKWLTTYYLDEKGVMQTGLTKIGEKMYFFKDNGHLVKSGWITDGDNKYYAKGDGVLAVNETIKKWGRSYTFDENGVLVP